MDDQELIRLPNQEAKYAAFRATIQWGIEQGLVKLPDGQADRQVRELNARIAAENRREAMARAQAIRLAETRRAKPRLGLAASQYYRATDQV